MTWLGGTPTCVVNAAVVMLPALAAEEARELASVVGVGWALKPGSARRKMAQWDAAVRRDPGDKKAPGAGSLAAMGIKVVKRG